MKIKKIIIFVLIVAAFAAGAYFKDDVISFYSNLNRKIEDLKEIDVGQIVSEAQKQILSPAPLKAGGTETKVTLLQSKIIAETNLQRQQNGNLPALKENKLLDNAAAAKANDMFLNQYFEHISPSGIGPGTLVQSYGYDYIIAGENLILGNFASEAEVVQDWMNSPGHRANILNNRYTEIGVAVIKGTYKGETVWIGVQEFGLPASFCLQPDKTLKDKIDFNTAQSEILLSQINEAKNQIDNSEKKSAVYRQMIEDYNQLAEQYNLLAEEIKTSVNLYNSQVNTFNGCVSGE